MKRPSLEGDCNVAEIIGMTELKMKPKLGADGERSFLPVVRCEGLRTEVDWPEAISN